MQLPAFTQDPVLPPFHPSSSSLAGALGDQWRAAPSSSTATRPKPPNRASGPKQGAYTNLGIEERAPPNVPFKQDTGVSPMAYTQLAADLSSEQMSEKQAEEVVSLSPRPNRPFLVGFLMLTSHSSITKPARHINLIFSLVRTTNTNRLRHQLEKFRQRQKQNQRSPAKTQFAKKQAPLLKCQSRVRQTNSGMQPSRQHCLRMDDIATMFSPRGRNTHSRRRHVLPRPMCRY